MNIDSITIVGVGLIGGSLADLIRGRLPDVEVVGVDHPSTLVQAKERGLIHRGYGPSDLSEAIATADLIILATPVPVVLHLLPIVLRSARPGTIVTDTASVKGPVLTVARESRVDGVHFIGGHPLAGSEQSGIEPAGADILSGARYTLVPDDAVPSEWVDLLEETLVNLGFHPLPMTADYHDRIVATTSHVPHLVAATLLRTAGTLRDDFPGLFQMAGRGFLDTTRIGRADALLWEGICLANRDAILDGLATFQICLEEARMAIEAGTVAPLFEEASELAEHLDRARSAALNEDLQTP